MHGTAGLFRRLMQRLRKRKQADPDDEEPQEGEEGWDPDKGEGTGGMWHDGSRVQVRHHDLASMSPENAS
jgi:hypothetical protein